MGIIIEKPGSYDEGYSQGFTAGFDYYPAINPPEVNYQSGYNAGYDAYASEHPVTPPDQIIADYLEQHPPNNRGSFQVLNKSAYPIKVYSVNGALSILKTVTLSPGQTVFRFYDNLLPNQSGYVVASSSGVHEVKQSQFSSGLLVGSTVVTRSLGEFTGNIDASILHVGVYGFLCYLVIFE